MQGDPKVIDYLNKGLRSELTAINQYWLHYRLLNNWGLLELAKTWRKESIEEMEHADKLIERIIFLDGFPNLQVLDPLRSPDGHVICRGLIDDWTRWQAAGDPRFAPAGKKGMLWTMTYRADDRTLTDAEVDAAHARVLGALSRLHTVTVR